MVASASILSLDEARATRRKTSDSHAPSNPRFIVRHAWPCRYELVDNHASSTKASVVGEYANFDAARTERDRMNAEYFAQVTR